MLHGAYSIRACAGECSAEMRRRRIEAHHHGQALRRSARGACFCFYEAACFPPSVPPPLLLTRPLLLIAQTMRYLAILPQDRGSDGKHDWSTLNFCFDEQVSPVRGTPPSADAGFRAQSTHPLTCCYTCASPHRSGTLASRRLAGTRFSASQASPDKKGRRLVSQKACKK